MQQFSKIIILFSYKKKGLPQTNLTFFATVFLMKIFCGGENLSQIS